MGPTRRRGRNRGGAACGRAPCRRTGPSPRPRGVTPGNGPRPRRGVRCRGLGGRREEHNRPESLDGCLRLSRTSRTGRSSVPREGQAADSVVSGEGTSGRQPGAARAGASVCQARGQTRAGSRWGEGGEAGLLTVWADGFLGCGSRSRKTQNAVLRLELCACKTPIRHGASDTLAGCSDPTPLSAFSLQTPLKRQFGDSVRWTPGGSRQAVTHWPGLRGPLGGAEADGAGGWGGERDTHLGT